MESVLWKEDLMAVSERWKSIGADAGGTRLRDRTAVVFRGRDKIVNMPVVWRYLNDEDSLANDENGAVQKYGAKIASDDPDPIDLCTPLVQSAVGVRVLYYPQMAGVREEGGTNEFG